MPIERLGTASPTAFSGSFTQLGTATRPTVASVIVVNRGTVSMTATIFVEPIQFPGSVGDRAYIIDNLVVQPGQTFETFRFALNVGDIIFVASSTANAAFVATGLYEQAGRANVVYQEIQPGSPQIGDIWINSNTDKVSVFNGAQFRILASIALVGPSGFAETVGPEGPRGFTGSTGPLGPRGPVGLIGPIGPAGVQGVVGPIGPIGNTGPVGPIGPIGPVGPQAVTAPATTSVAGIVELATAAETLAGTDSVRAVTPVSLEPLSSRLTVTVADFTALSALATTNKLVGDLAFVVEGEVYMSWTGTGWRQSTTSRFATTAARDTAYAKASALFRVPRARALDLSTGVESERVGTAPGAWILDFVISTTAFTPSAGYTFTNTFLARQGRVVSLKLRVTRTINWVNGDVIGSINDASFFPGQSQNHFFTVTNDNVAVFAAVVQGDGVIRIYATGSVSGTVAHQMTTSWITL